LESYNLGWGEEYKLQNIKNKSFASEMIKYLEKNEDLKIDTEKDCVQLVFDKRTHRYIFMFNIQEGERKDMLIIYESDQMGNVRNSFKY